MKACTEYLTFNTRKRVEIVNITSRVEEIVKKSGIQEGFVLVSAMHITASVFINDDEEGFREDLLRMLSSIAPQDGSYRHNLTGEDNGYAHMWNILVHHEVIVPVTGGQLDLGPWQRIFYGEWDGRRPKRLVIKVMGV